MPFLIALASFSQRHTVFITTFVLMWCILLQKNSLMISRARYHGSENLIHHLRDLKQYDIIVLDLLR